MSGSQMAIDSLKLTRVLSITRNHLWELIVDDHRREQWWPETTIDVAPGGVIRSTFEVVGSASDSEAEPTTERVTHSGEVDVVIAGHALGFSWRQPEDPWATTTLMTLTSLSGITQLSVVELGFMGYPDESQRMRQSFAAWEQRLARLEDAARQAVVAGG